MGGVLKGLTGSYDSVVIYIYIVFYNIVLLSLLSLICCILIIYYYKCVIIIWWDDDEYGGLALRVEKKAKVEIEGTDPPSFAKATMFLFI